MDDPITRFFPELMGRATGPMMFRFILQPLVPMFYAYRDGCTMHESDGHHASRWHSSCYSWRSLRICCSGVRSIGWRAAAGTREPHE